MKCKVCKKKSENECCSVECALKYIEIKKQLEWNERKKKLSESLESRADLLDKLQKDFNTFVRYRDLGKECISCNTILKDIRDYHAGHFYDTKCEILRFDEYNVHGQCIQCNKHFHGNLIKYRIKIADRIGEYNLAYLDNQSENRLKFSILEIKSMHEEVKKRLKIIKK